MDPGAGIAIGTAIGLVLVALILNALVVRRLWAARKFDPDEFSLEGVKPTSFKVPGEDPEPFDWPRFPVLKDSVRDPHRQPQVRSYKANRDS